MQPVEKKKTSPWVYVGIGCGILLLLGVGGVVAAVLVGAKMFKGFQEEMTNPVTRTEKVKKTLGAPTLPEGYHAVMALSVPAVIDTAILSTRTPDAPAQADAKPERVFIYLFVKAASMNDTEELRAYLEGRSDDASVLARNNIDIRTSEIIGRGAIPLEGRRVLYLSQRGELESDNGQSQGPGLNAITLIECPGESLLRMGLWITPDPSPETPIEQLDVKGTPADPEAVRAFMSHFNPCQEN
ncbi:hypothetical protein [Hyalangium gracile]|uniref:hypothetical protein n=1 Tax=Hyalangium gracile TaxID=394092 RepID=UPI001CC91368|nr:hypothetical protein [Hyalangium gracile]